MVMPRNINKEKKKEKKKKPTPETLGTGAAKRAAEAILRRKKLLRDI